MVAELIPHPGPRSIDLGSGAGLPGIVLAMLLPEAEVTLLEPMARRVAFLEECVRSSGSAMPRSGGAGPRMQAGQLAGDVVTARAVAPLDQLAGLAMGLTGPAAWFSR